MIAAIRQEVRRAIAGTIVADVGEVKQVNWREQVARVKLASSGQLSGWLRVGAQAAWAQGGTVAPLRGGDEVVCLFLDGNPGGAGVVVCRLYGACSPSSGLAENSFGWAQGQHKILFGADGKAVLQVTELQVTADGPAEIDGSVVKLGGGLEAATKFESLDGAVTPWTTTVSAVLAALGITVGPPVLAGARANKVLVG